MMIGKEKRYLDFFRTVALLILFQASRFDDDVDDYLTEIETKYAAGNCDTHPDKECFHHRPTDNHFELTRAQKIFWAAKIVCFIPI